jgi:hypothetical protein
MPNSAKCDGIELIAALTERQISRAMKQQCSLLLGALDWNKAHRRPLYSLANRFRIGGIVLFTLYVRLYKLWRHQPHIMPRATSSRAQ